jgi:hypothetical protein
MVPHPAAAPATNDVAHIKIDATNNIACIPYATLACKKAHFRQVKVGMWPAEHS